MSANKDQIEQHIVDGTAPLFGYPGILYEK